MNGLNGEGSVCDIRTTWEIEREAVARAAELSIGRIARRVKGSGGLEPRTRGRSRREISAFVMPSPSPREISWDGMEVLHDICRRIPSFDPCSVSPGVIVQNPSSQPTGTGTGYLTVVWTPAQAALAGLAYWWTNPASPHPIPTTTFPLSAGNATVTFGPLAGYTPPAPKLIHIWKGQTTTLTVTYGQP